MPNSSQMHTPELQELFGVKGVEIFSTGLWNGKQITDKDLDAIVESFSKIGGVMKPHLKLGHNEKQPLLESAGLPAAGWVENVRKVGGKLVADFVDIPRQIFQLIKNKAYRKVSCEIYNDIDIEGQRYPKLLGAVALLGAETPGVMNLKDILSQYNLTSKFKMVQTFTGENSIDIIDLDINEHSESEMDEVQKQLDAALEQNKALQGQIDAFNAKMEAFQAQFDQVKKSKEDVEKELADARRATEEAEADKFVTELQAEKLCSKAMAPFVKAALSSERVEKYSLESKEYSRKDLIKEILRAANEASKVNFSNETANTNEADKADKVDEVEKYSKEHNVSYSEAYRIVNKKA